MTERRQRLNQLDKSSYVMVLNDRRDEKDPRRFGVMERNLVTNIYRCSS